MAELSIIIPAHNAQKHLKPLLDSIFEQDFKDFEVLLVDDASSDSTREIASGYNINYVRLDENSGPSHARNLGAQKAVSENLVFFDSDVVLTDGVLRKFHDWLSDGKTNAINGIYDKFPINKGLVPTYKAFQEQVWFNEEAKSDCPVIFNTSVGAIKKSFFWDAGGFDTAYRGAEVEDYDFSFRVLKKTRIMLDRSIRVGHNFPYLKKLLTTFFRRAFLWARLFTRHKKFSSSGTNERQAMVTIAYSASVFLLFGCALFRLPFTGVLCLASLLSALILDGKFIAFNYKNRGLFFTLFGIGMGILTSIFIISAVLAGFTSVFHESLCRKTGQETEGVGRAED